MATALTLLLIACLLQNPPQNTTVSVSPSGPVPEDSTVTLTCSSTANPAVRDYTWYTAQGGQETVMGTGHVLHIQASKVSVPFFCKAENDLGAGRSNINQIHVQYPPKHTTVSVSPSGPVPEDSTVTLICFSAANPAVRDYTWYTSQGGQETVIGTGHVLHIQASEVSVPFFCKAENDLGAGRSTISQIDVQYSPKHTTVSVSPSGPVPEDSTVTLTCSSTANPAVSDYTWYTSQGGQETVMGTGHVLHIQASKVSVPFFCEAENDLGAGRSTISQIDVQYSVMLTVFITTVVALLLIVCALLLVIRIQKIRRNRPESTFAMNQLLTSNVENEVSKSEEPWTLSTASAKTPL
ncbi:B-cell receptor CD22 [Larimichthys crocea]|uniref:Uncharacterized protein n=1 Tax=Larimichthys crocea TaxID=215358 RepID=A0ACD3QUU3_LARCR|nr:B-cell receptor CD22 [Larimichthys crocea]